MDKLVSLSETFADQYPHSGKQNLHEAGIEIQKDKQLVFRSKDHGLHRIIIKTEDKTQVAQLRLDGFTFSRLEPYIDWPHFSSQASELWKEYFACVKPDEITRIAVRFINQMKIPPTSFSNLNKFLSVAPSVPGDIQAKPDNLLSKLTMNFPDKNIQANIIQAIKVNSKSETDKIILDIDVFQNESFEVCEDIITSTLTNLKEIKNDVFFKSITEETVEIFK